MGRSSSTPSSRDRASSSLPDSPPLKDIVKDEAPSFHNDHKVVSDYGVIDHRSLLLKSFAKSGSFVSAFDGSSKIPSLAPSSSSSPAFPRPPKRPKGSNPAPLPADMLKEAIDFFSGNLNTENVRQVTPDSLLHALDCSGAVSCLAAYSVLHSKKLSELLQDSNKKLHEANKRLNDRVRGLMSEVFDLGHELESLCGSKKSLESSLTSVNEKLRVEAERYQILESDSSLLMRRGFSLAREEVMRLYPDLDLSKMSVPPAPVPVAVISPLRDDAANPGVVAEDDPSEDDKA